MSDAARVGLVGCGNWGRHILRDLRLLGCVVEVADPDAGSRSRALAEGAIAAAPSAAQWQPGALDGFVVAAPTADHGALVGELLASGKPVFCEKPLTADTATARDIVRRGADRVFVMHKWRYHPGIEAIAGLAQAGTCGSVREIYTRRLQWTPEQPDAIWTLAPHDLSIVFAVLGRMPAAVAAVGRDDGPGHAASLIGLLRDPQGPEVAVHVSAVWPRNERSVCVTFEDATALLDDPLADHVKIFRRRGAASGAAERLGVSTEFPLIRELRAFVEHIGGGPPPKTTAAEGLLIVETIDRLRRLAGMDAR